jgi:hypothetical protein
VNKLNCNSGNYQCGGKCQPDTNNCHVKKSEESSEKIETVVEAVKMIDSKVTWLEEELDISEFPKEVRQLLVEFTQIDSNNFDEYQAGVDKLYEELEMLEEYDIPSEDEQPMTYRVEQLLGF